MPAASLRAASAALVALVTVAVLAPAQGRAQSQLDAAQAKAFLGEWAMSLQTDFGPLDIEMVIEDKGGKVAATVGSPDFGMQSVTDITRAGERLVLKYDVDAQGQYVDVQLQLEPDGNNLKFWIEAAAGQFSMSGTATRTGG